jgi:hypothetical protein
LVGDGKRRSMAGRNRNTFLKRQKEMERVQRAREKMARRHGNGAAKAGRDAEEPPAEMGISSVTVAAGMDGPNPEGSE